MKHMYTIAVSIRMSTGLRSKLAELAKADKRTLANYLRLVLEAHVAETEQQKRRTA